MSNTVARRLRPYLFHGFKRTQCHRTFSRAPALHKQDDAKPVTHDYEKRIAELSAQRPLSECYPRLNTSPVKDVVPLDKFRSAWANLTRDETREDDGPVTIAGMF